VGPFHWENVIDQHGRERARRLRLPEIMRLMTFPNDFVLVADRRTFQRQLGNAVPVELGKVVVRAVMEQLGYLEPLSQPEIYQPELL
jgi:DNA (cytosine-5)-methyltransferase 1